jgi:general L-amino acid transport system permease protein
LGDGAVTQFALLVLIVLVFQCLGSNLAANMRAVGITPGFGFLGHAANFQIGESVIPYQAGDSYGRAILAGLLNTVKVAVSGCILAMIVGVALGVARLSTNPLLAWQVQAFVELVRNTPLLLQLFFWNAVMHGLPGPRQALAPVTGVMLSNRGLFVPSIETNSPGTAAVLLIFMIAAVVFLAKGRRLGLAAAAGILGTGAWALAHGATLAMELPRLQGFNIAGGLSLSPEFAALLIGLVVNTSASIAETVRGGIVSVSSGQWEAGAALGLKRLQVLRLIVLPQALRVIIPVVTSSFLSLTKNSSLAVAIGYPDLVSVLNTTANTTGQALETIFIMMVVYLTLSLAVSVLMNAYNRRWKLRENAR